MIGKLSNPALLRMITKRIVFRSLWQCVHNTWLRFSDERQARILRKILENAERRRPSQIPSCTTTSNYAVKTLSGTDSKRNEMLNKVFMENICNILSTGENNEEMVNLGIQIIEVKFTKNRHLIYIYWVNTKPIDDNKVNDFLTRVSRTLRQELIGLHLLSRVPHIRFVLHSKFLELQKLETILNTSDFKFLDSDSEQKQKQNTPVMVDNIFGVSRSKILANIEIRKNKPSKPIESIRPSVSGTQVSFDRKQISKEIFGKIYQIKKEKKLAKEMYNDIIQSGIQNTEDGDENTGTDDFDEYNERIDDIIESELEHKDENYIYNFDHDRGKG
ncbi:UNVERIFIED_CONTAM: hypothetical protein PYX00_000458 [Menopon gallinae]|uniref:Ribosome-binding factor A, mitochondrial n=1 Tax=Menopon gallinae TaxID=328185 RepID=A0AAW2IAD5_9NEOP